MNYITDVQGQVLERWEGTKASSAIDPKKSLQFYYNFNGVRVGDIGNSGAGQTDYTSIVDSRTVPPSSGFISRPAANFDQGFDAVTPNGSGEGMTALTYTARAGDTLRNVAKVLWGDEARPPGLLRLELIHWINSPLRDRLQRVHHRPG